MKKIISFGLLLAVSIEKTKVYEDKIVVFFSKGAFSEVGQ